MAGEHLREMQIGGNGVDLENLANEVLGPLEALRNIIDRGGEVGGPALCSASLSDVLGALLGSARTTILRAGCVAMIALALIMAATPTTGHAATKKIVIIGTVDCGQDTCSVVPLKKNTGQPALYFVIKSKAGGKILPQAQASSFGPLQMTVIVDNDDNIVDVVKIARTK